MIIHITQNWQTGNKFFCFVKQIKTFYFLLFSNLFLLLGKNQIKLVVVITVILALTFNLPASDISQYIL